MSLARNPAGSRQAACVVWRSGGGPPWTPFPAIMPLFYNQLVVIIKTARDFISKHNKSGAMRMDLS
jgi:hypothetical protein